MRSVRPRWPAQPPRSCSSPERLLRRVLAHVSRTVHGLGGADQVLEGLSVGQLVDGQAREVHVLGLAELPTFRGSALTPFSRGKWGNRGSAGVRGPRSVRGHEVTRGG